MFSICFVLIISVLQIHVSADPCAHVLKDMVFVMDASKSISESDFELAKQSIIHMIDSLGAVGKNNRVAVLMFGNSPDLLFNIDNKLTKEEMIKKIKATKNMNSLTGIGLALKFTEEQILPKLIKHFERMVFLFTDGTNNMYPAPFIYAENLKAKGVKIVTMGVGSDTDNSELERIATRSMNFQVLDFKAVTDKLTYIMKNLCPIVEPPPKLCSILTRVDFVIVQDGSSSLTEEDYEASKERAFSFIEPDEQYKSEMRFAFVQFSDDAQLEFNLGDYNYTESWNQMKKAKRIGRTTSIGLGLMEVEEKVLPKRRPHTPFVVLLVTDGINTRWPRPETVAKRLKEAGVIIIVIGVGPNVSVDEMKHVATPSMYYTIEKATDYKYNKGDYVRKLMLGVLACDMSMKY